MEILDINWGPYIKITNKTMRTFCSHGTNFANFFFRNFEFSSRLNCRNVSSINHTNMQIWDGIYTRVEHFNRNQSFMCACIKFFQILEISAALVRNESIVCLVYVAYQTRLSPAQYNSSEIERVNFVFSICGTDFHVVRLTESKG